jgi:hypothetical protein
MSVPNPATTEWVPLQGTRLDGMTYWGAYEATRTYYDGDCAIGSDGVLYMCVKDGTIGTAPVKWPGRMGPQGPKGDTGPQGIQGVGIPMPVVNGQWIKGVGGAAVWSPIAPIDIGGAGLVRVYAGANISGPWSPVKPMWTITLPFKADVTLIVNASLYTNAIGMCGTAVWWDGATLPNFADYFFNEASSHKMAAVCNIISGAASGNHTIQVVYGYGSCLSDSGDRANFSAVAVAVP